MITDEGRRTLYTASSAIASSQRETSTPARPPRRLIPSSRAERTQPADRTPAALPHLALVLLLARASRSAPSSASASSSSESFYLRPVVSLTLSLRSLSSRWHACRRAMSRLSLYRPNFNIPWRPRLLLRTPPRSAADDDARCERDVCASVVSKLRLGWRGAAGSRSRKACVLVVLVM
jgi:hypothetical protein